MNMAASGSGLLGRGLDISLAALQRHDPYITRILDVASQVALYTFSQKTNEWEKTDVEGTLFVYTRSASPKHGFTIMNRLSMENRTEPITKDLDFQLQDPFLLYRNARFCIYGIWFYDKEECQRIAELMKNLTKHEQLKAHHETGVSPMTLNSGEGKEVDILQMLNKAKEEYTKCKSSSEPKQITSSSAIYNNPNLIKPIAVKPNEDQQQKTDSAGDQDIQYLSLTALFGKPTKLQEDVTHHIKTHLAHHTVVRSLSYEEPSTVPEDCEKQLCPAIQKLLVRGAELHPVSEIPENRQCLNGTFHPAEDIFSGLSQPMLTPASFHVHNSENGKSLLQKLHVPQSAFTTHDQGAPTTAQGLTGERASAFGKSTVQVPLNYYETSLQSTSASMPPLPVSSQLPPASRSISPQELLKKLQLVRQEQQLHSNTRPALAAKFPVVSQSGPNSSWGEKISGEKQKTLFQVSSPQRIPATVPPTLLLSPMVFTQSNHQTRPSDSKSMTVSSKECSVGSTNLLAPMPVPDAPVCSSVFLTKTQLQETLLHLVQNDSDFLNTIYESYLSVLVKGSAPGRKI
ncbi:mRNA-decapping enzyme 1B isoform X1 [Bombina bombina]|uniref:mRNA-decapping enzyme 1B isoform X1 n=1 Tax=Bombina bombina TaxID=8345 RepID=UPI00235A6AFE|nr:mRNA-decapping enzyme 1B isoform X1 [Bombina bombina]